MDLQKLIEQARRFKAGAVDAYGDGREDHRIAFKRASDDKGVDVDAARIQNSFGTNRTITMVREMMGMQHKENAAVLKSMGMDLSPDPATRAGQVLGHLGADITQDRSRELWWLLNAPQASVNVVQELATKHYAPDLFKSDPVLLEDGTSLRQTRDNLTAKKMGAIGPDNRTTKGHSIDQKGIIHKRRLQPGHLAALEVPAGFATNWGIGLMNPFGGSEGYAAAIPSEEDRSVSANPIAEVGAKYILGRTGNLLPWTDFQKVRPDVSKDEYMRYKAFKFDNDVDMNPLDGDLIGPMGVAKYTNEGIHGPEVQFLGRSLPISTALLPAATAIAGTTYGATKRNKPIQKGFAYGMAGAIGGRVIGNIIENERRKRNAAENGIQL
jgi:hypothetical protein